MVDSGERPDAHLIDGQRARIPVPSAAPLRSGPNGTDQRRSEPQSDLDFLVIKRGVTSRRRLAQAIYRALVGVPASIDIVVVTPEDVDALKHGVATIGGLRVD